MPALEREEILRIHTAAIAAHLGTNRDALLSGLPPALTQSLPVASGSAAQLLVDLETLNKIEILTDDMAPLRIWLENAIAIVGPRIQSAAFHNALAALKDSTKAQQSNGWALSDVASAADDELGCGGRSHEAQTTERRVGLLIRTKLPCLLAACEMEPKPVLIRAGVPTNMVAGQTRLDQWTYVCEWLSNAGIRGAIMTLRIVDGVQSESFSDRLSRWASDFVQAMLKATVEGGGGDEIAQLRKYLKQFVTNEAHRWDQLRREVDMLTKSNKLSEGALRYVQDMSSVWGRVSHGFARIASGTRDTPLLLQTVYDQLRQEVDTLTKN